MSRSSGAHRHGLKKFAVRFEDLKPESADAKKKSYTWTSEAFSTFTMFQSSRFGNTSGYHQRRFTGDTQDFDNLSDDVWRMPLRQQARCAPATWRLDVYIYI